MGALWERLVEEGETPKAFRAFKIYRDMQPHERSMRAVAEELGYTSSTQVERWAARDKFRWYERALAYDDWRDHSILTVRQSNIEDAQQTILQHEGAELAALQLIVESAMAQMLDKKDKADTLSISRLAGVLDKLQVMRRRNLGMPAVFVREGAEDIIVEQPIFKAIPEEIEDTYDPTEDEG